MFSNKQIVVRANDDLAVDTNGLRASIEPCSASCAAPCCWGAAGVTRREIERIEAVLPGLLSLLSPAATNVISRKGFYSPRTMRRPDFAIEDDAHWMRIVAGRCVFYGDFQGGHCALHTYAALRGLPVLELKPLTCYLFPISKPIAGHVGLRRWAELRCLQPGGAITAVPAYIAYGEQLQVLLGEAGYRRFVAYMQSGEGSPDRTQS